MTKLCTWDESITVLNSQKDVIRLKYIVVDTTFLLTSGLWLFIFIIYTLSKCLRPSTKSSAVSVIFFDETACKIGRNVSNDTRSDAFCVCTKRLTSASVGFCPRARRTSPTWFAWKKRVIFSDNQIKERPEIRNNSNHFHLKYWSYRDHSISLCVEKHKSLLEFTNKIFTEGWFSRHRYGTETKKIIIFTDHYGYGTIKILANLFMRHCIKSSTIK